MARLILKKDRAKSVLQRHPWIFSGAIDRFQGEAHGGDIVEVATADGQLLGRAYVNPRSQIFARMLTWDPAAPVDEAFWRARLARAVAARPAALSACRLVNAEADGLPGLIVDRYGDYLVLQSLTLGIETHKEVIVQALAGLSAPRGIYERSDADVREKEGLVESCGLLWGEEPPELIEITEAAHDGRPLRLLVDVRRGHKTGFYLDQRENRRRAAPWLAGRETLNLFAYTGAFSVHALAAGATRVVNVDASADALAMARRNLELNGLPAPAEDFVEANVFELLRRYRNDGRQFDAIILDPPKLAFTAAQIDKASRAYKDLNLLAMKLLRPGGVLITFSCSGRVSFDLFQKIVFGAMLDAGREAAILERLGQPADHPIALAFPEGEYLKGLICRVS